MPARQDEQVVAEAVARYLPAPQPPQAELATAPVADDEVPPLHALQPELPVMDW